MTQEAPTPAPDTTPAAGSARRSPGAPSTRRRTWIACAAALAVAACGETAETASAGGTDATTANLLQSAEPRTGSNMSRIQGQAPGQAPQREIDVSVLGFDYGSSEAPVRVVEFSDYGCGYCRQFHREGWKELRAEFVEQGKIEWKFLPFVTGMFQNSPVATEGAECALEQGDAIFEAMNERLWEDQSAWKQSNDPAPAVRAMAEASGADMARWDACVQQDRRWDRVVSGSALARQLGIRGTPTFFIVGAPPLQGLLPTEEFRGYLQLVYDRITELEGEGG